ncbi:MAG: CSLREA domain-containing protein [Chloroflexi bacterium]|nr:CSLREA domain-containing protein [Chloroflexota bacterium]
MNCGTHVPLISIRRCHASARSTAVRVEFTSNESNVSANPILEVTTQDDTFDGTCNSDCSLRDALVAANASAGLDEINLPAGAFTT